MHSVAANGLTFDTWLDGPQDGVPVLFLHGFPQTAYTWRDQIPAMAARGYRAIAPNQRGYSAGARPQNVRDYDTPVLLQDALAVVDAAGAPGSAFHLVGHDWGGQLAWLLAAEHPDRVRTLTVLSRPHPQAFVDAFAEDAEQAERSRHHRAFQDASAADGLLADGARRLRAIFEDQGVAAEDAQAYLRVVGDADALDAAINWYRAPVRTAAEREAGALARSVSAVTVPTVYIWGDNDATVGRVAAERTATYVAAPYDFCELADVGHFVTDQAGTAVTQRLLEHVLSHD